MAVTNRDPPRPDDLIGRRIGGYQIERQIGEGGMGAVYAAVNARLGKSAAVKVISRAVARNLDVAARFRREARTIAAIDDPNVVEIFDLHEIDGASCILMPLIGGVSLEELCLQMGPMPLLEVFVISAQIASGLDAAHAASVVHRDIKPQNIMIERRQRRRYFVRIVDFGIARLLDPRLAAGYRSRTLSVVGTVGYMAPEQAGGRDVDARADVYALGVVLYRMLTGRTPYQDATLYGLIEKQVQEAPFPRPRELRPDVPASWDDAIMAAMEVDRGRRLGSVKELARLLARGLRNGEDMLRVLAPRLCLDAPPGADGATLTGDLDVSLERWSSVRTPAASRAGMRMRAAAFALAGAVIGAAAALLASTTLTAGAPDRDDQLSAVPVPEEAVATPSPVRPDAAPADAGVSPRITGEGGAGARRGAGIAGAAPAVIVAPAPKPERPARGGSSPKPPEPTPPPAAPIAGREEKSAILVVRARTWAQVWIDAKAAGQTPIRLRVTPGAHSVLMINDGHRETIPVTARANAEVIVEKNW